MDQKHKVALGTICAFLFGLCLSGEALGQSLPDGTGKAEFVHNCTACHRADMVTRVKKTPDEWKKSVFEMASRGTDGTKEDLDKVVLYLDTFYAAGQAPAPKATPSTTPPSTSGTTSELRARIGASPVLPFQGVPFAAQPPHAGWESGTVSGVAVDSKGLIYEIQRGVKADPVLVLDRNGTILRSWGKGDFKLPHSIRIDPAGNVWTVDAAASTVIKYSPSGKKLMTIAVGEQPDNGSPFNGTTDVGFGPNGHIFITDGYGNARVLEYTADGKRVKQWGKPGSAPGDFNLPHAIQITAQGIVYVADRENGRIERFDLQGNFLGEIAHLGRIYSFKLTDGALWATVGPFDQPPGALCWVVKLDPQSGRILGHLDVPEGRGGHSIEVMPSGEPLITLGNELLWFKKK